MREETVIKGDLALKDERGSITNYVLPEPINLIGLIYSKKGTVRANHYHPVQQQKAMLIKGAYTSVYKDISGPGSKTKSHLIMPGDIVVTPPMVAHAMVFTEDSIFLNLVNGNRDSDKFDDHTKKYAVVDSTGKII